VQSPDVNVLVYGDTGTYSWNCVQASSVRWCRTPTWLRSIEHGCELITTDSDFARFKGLRWRHPFGA